MPEYDETFLSDCAKFEKQKWRLYKNKYKFKCTKNSYNLNSISDSQSRFFKIESIANGESNYCDSGTTTPCPSGHKSSLRGTKLARRARSFKDDFLEKISQIRTPTSTMIRSHSPNRMSTPRTKHHKGSSDEAASLIKPIHDIHYHVRQVKNALKHFQDVVSKNKLEMLSGNGTVVLESIANIHAALTCYTLNEQSSTVISARNHMYQSLGRLIKLCDEISINSGENNSVLLNDENIKEIVELVENSVQSLVNIANEKAAQKNDAKITSNTLQRPMIDHASQRTSLPDIPLTPRERDILEQTSTVVRPSHSTESVLRDTSPTPSKPPLPPNRNTDPPPLPPKRRSQHKQHNSFHDTTDSNNSDSTYLATPYDRMSLRSKSPEDNSSQLSASAGSLDSALNISREEDEELRCLGLDNESIDTLQNPLIMNNNNEFKISKNISILLPRNFEETDNCNESSILSIYPKQNYVANESGISLATESASHKNIKNGTTNRNSNESGFASMHSIRSSDQSFNAKTSSTFTNTSQQSMSSVSTALQKNEIVKLEQSKIHLQNNCESSEYITVNKQISNQLIINRKLHSSSTDKTSSYSFDYDDVFAATSAKVDCELPPALPIKTRSLSFKKERHKSHYDNVDENEVERNFADEFSHISVHNSHIAISKLNYGLPSKHQSLIEPRHYITEVPPPLPIKKKHIMAYMEIFGNYSHSTQNSSAEPVRHSVHTYNLSHASDNFGSFSHGIAHSHTMSLSPTRTQISSPPESPKNYTKPPALPPKRHRLNSKTPSVITTPPTSPKILQDKSPSIYNIENNLNTLSSPPSTSSISPLGSNDKVFHDGIKCKTLDANSNPNQNSIDNKNNNNKNNISINNNNNMDLMNDDATTTPVVILPANNDNNNPKVSVTNSNTNNSSNTYNDDVTEVVLRKNKSETQVHNNEINVISSSNLNSDNIVINDSKVEIVLRDYISDESKMNSTENKSDTDILNSNETMFNMKNENIAADSDIQELSNNERIYENKMIDENLVDVVLRRSLSSSRDKPGDNSEKYTKILIEELDVFNHLVFKKSNEEGPDVRGGHSDALIIHATKSQKVSEAYGEAFITTFRTFLTPLELIQKLIHRYTIFICQANDQKQKAAKESFSLLVRVVCDLTSPDLTIALLNLLKDFVYQIVCSGQLSLAKSLRLKIMDKVDLYKLKLSTYANNNSNSSMPTHTVIINPPTLLDLKSSDIAEQMTLLDAELFQKIEIPEVLIWAQEQCEDRSPNLTLFTEHFNKMSYWARSQILKHEDAKDREKHVVKFIKIMKHLRKINNYNSYLALLSALDSAPIRRLEWHKTITEGLKEYCALIDSSSSFRAYRQALAETNSPCIPYIGLVLQDLTFVHIGNPDLLPDGSINFSKRWQQYNIVENMKRFKDGSYIFKKNDRIIGFFENFENYLDEDTMWQISESIKPRGSRK